MTLSEHIVTVKYFDKVTSVKVRSAEYNFANNISVNNYRFQAIQWLRFGRFDKPTLHVVVSFHSPNQFKANSEKIYNFADKVSNGQIFNDCSYWLSKGERYLVIIKVLSPQSIDYSMTIETKSYSKKVIDEHDSFAPAPRF